MGTGTTQAQVTRTGAGLVGSRLASAALLAAAGVCASTAHAQPAGFWRVGRAPGSLYSQVDALSADGRVAAGRAEQTSVPPDVGLLWTREGGRVDVYTSPVPNYGPKFQGLSGDGRYGAGEVGPSITPSGGSRVFRRDNQSGTYDLIEPLPG
jgi:hypothetical protein